MKKSAKLKRKTRRLIIKNLIVFVVLIAVTVAGVRSWYYNDTKAKAVRAEGVTAICSVPEGLEVAIVAPGASVTSETVWHDETFEITAEDYPFISGLSFTEVTGDGKGFVKPKIMQYGSVAVADTTHVNLWTTAIANSEYLSFDIYFRSLASTPIVKLDESTYCGPESSTQQWGDNTNGWSPHTVIGATRVAVEEVTVSGGNTTLTQKLLWIPAPFLHYDPVNRNGDAQLISNITDTSNTYGLVYTNESNQVISDNNGTYNHGYYTKSGNTATRSKILYNSNVANAGTNVTANTSIDAADKYHLPYDVPITQFNVNNTATYDGKTYYQKCARVNIWVEGEDPESRSAQVTGQFKAILNFKL